MADGRVIIDTSVNGDGAKKDLNKLEQETISSTKALAAKLAQVYRKNGDDQSTAMKKAWAEVRADAEQAANKIGLVWKGTTTSIKQEAESLSKTKLSMAIDANTQWAEAKVAKVSGLLKSVTGKAQQIRVDAETKLADSKLGKVKGLIKTVTGKARQIKVNAETKLAESKLGKVQALIKTVAGKAHKVKVNADTSGATSKLSGVTGGLGNIVTKLGLVAAAAKIAQTAMSLIGKGVAYNASIETYQTSFEVMTGSAEEAAKVVEELKKKSAETPFEMPELADTTQLLINYGFTADEAIDRMSMLGDISQGSADKMNRIATAYGQMSSAGKVQLEDVKQMIEAGFNPLQEISQTTGESMESLYDRISSGTLSVDEITASMQRSTAEGGKYFQSMEKQSQTFTGMMSTLKDNANQLLGNVMMPITNAISDTLLPTAIGAIDQMTTAFQTNGFQGLIAAGGQVINNFVLGIAGQLPTLIPTAVDALMTFLSGFTSNIGTILNTGMQILLGLVQGILAAIPNIIAAVPQIIGNFISGIITNLPQIIQTGINLVFSLITGLIRAIPDLVMAIPQLITAMQDAFRNVDWPQLGKDIINGIIDGLKSMGTALWDAAQELGGDILGFFQEKFKINSPSKVMRDIIGVGITEGIGAGITKGESYALNAVDALGSSILSKAKDINAGEMAIPMTVAATGEASPDTTSPQEEYTVMGEGVVTAMQTMAAGVDTEWQTVNAASGQIVTDMTRRDNGMITAFTEAVTANMQRFGVTHTDQWRNLNGVAQVILQDMSRRAISQTAAMVGGIVAQANSLPGQLRAVGSAAIGELIGGINSRRGEAESTTSSLVQGLLNKFKEGLGIHSPSREMFSIGQYMLQGLINGLDGDNLLQFVDNIVGTIKNNFSSINLKQLISAMGNDAVKLWQKLGINFGSGAFGQGGMMWPSDSRAITSYFGGRESPGGIGSTNHGGIDIGAAMGTPIYAALPGTVTLAGWNGGYGNCVIIDHGGGMQTLYGHMSAVGTTAGQNVLPGQVIGFVGSTGNSTGPHLHFSVLQGGAFLDPMMFFPGFKVGSKYIPRDMLAYVHQGEAVLRKDENPYANSGGSFWTDMLKGAINGQNALLSQTVTGGQHSQSKQSFTENHYYDSGETINLYQPVATPAEAYRAARIERKRRAFTDGK